MSEPLVDITKESFVDQASAKLEQAALDSLDLYIQAVKDAKVKPDNIPLSISRMIDKLQVIQGRPTHLTASARIDLTSDKKTNLIELLGRKTKRVDVETVQEKGAK